jgi:hypothetical protein
MSITLGMGGGFSLTLECIKPRDDFAVNMMPPESMGSSLTILQHVRELFPKRRFCARCTRIQMLHF